MSIRNMDSYIKNLWDWKVLNGCFGDSKTAVSDIDGIIERHGQFLVIEAKSAGKDIPMGQSILLSALAKLDAFKVLIVWGEPGHVVAMSLWPGAMFNATNETFRATVAAWYKKANQGARSIRGPHEATPKDWGDDYAAR